MKSIFTPEWLARKLEHADDSLAGASGTTLEQLRKETEALAVTPTVFGNTQNNVGMVVRFVREERGWTKQQLADIASVDVAHIEAIETQVSFSLPPRSVSYLAEALGFSKQRFQEMVGHVVKRDQAASNSSAYQFIANSKGNQRLSDKQYEAVALLVKMLTEK